MDPIGTLMAEHRVIEALLYALERYAERLVRDQDADPTDLGPFVHFLAEYVDEHHHGKEEDLLFSALVEEGGLDAQMGPIAAMLDQHDHGRQWVMELSELAGRSMLGPADREVVRRTVAEYATMLREHILVEDGVLYPLAQGRLSDHVLGELEHQFERFEQAARRVGRKEELERSAAELCARHTRVGQRAPNTPSR